MQQHNVTSPGMAAAGGVAMSCDYYTFEAGGGRGGGWQLAVVGDRQLRQCWAAQVDSSLTSSAAQQSSQPGRRAAIPIRKVSCCQNLMSGGCRVEVEVI